MKIALIEECNEVTLFGGVVITPDEITPKDIPRLYAEYDAEWRKVDRTDEKFIDWLIRTHGCTEDEEVGFAFVGWNHLPVKAGRTLEQGAC